MILELKLNKQFILKVNYETLFFYSSQLSNNLNNILDLFALLLELNVV